MRRLLLTACVAAVVSQAAAQPDPLASAWARVGEYATSRMRRGGTPGLALAITSRERLLHTAAFGFANLPAQRPMTTDALFQIGSISKSFTAVALLQLREEGRFDPHEPIASYLPWFGVRSSYAPITGHHLLTHTSGLPRDRDDVPSSPYQAYGVKERETGYAPGSHYAYSNIGYQVLGYALERVAKEPYAGVIEQRILKPLGMAASASKFTHATRPRLAIGYNRLYDDRPTHPGMPLVPATWIEYAAGDGSIVSTPADMAAYARMILNRGAADGGARVLSEDGFKQLTQRAIPDGEKRWYGYGISTSERDGRVLLSHSGGMVGYSSMLVADPEAGVAVVSFMNGPGDPGEVANFALDVARAATRGEALPDVPEIVDAAIVSNAHDYDGTYTSGRRTIVLKSDDTLLTTPLAGGSALLERRGRDSFYLNDPAWDLFLMRFERQNGTVIGFSHGGDWYSHSERRSPDAPAAPAEWNAYPGHYRTTHAWFNNFRIVVRRGVLYLMPPDGGEMKLQPLGPGLFKEDGTSSERIRFDSVVDGKALRVNLSGVDYYRVFTP